MEGEKGIEKENSTWRITYLLQIGKQAFEALSCNSVSFVYLDWQCGVCERIKWAVKQENSAWENTCRQKSILCPEAAGSHINRSALWGGQSRGQFGSC